jgi:hypothetical protein
MQLFEYLNDSLDLSIQAAKEARYDKEALIKFFRMVCAK